MHFGTAGEILILTDLKMNPCCLKCSVATIASEVLEKVTNAMRRCRVVDLDPKNISKYCKALPNV